MAIWTCSRHILPTTPTCSTTTMGKGTLTTLRGAHAWESRPGTYVGAPESSIWTTTGIRIRSEEHTSELQSQSNIVCRLLLEKKKRAPTTIAPCVSWPVRTRNAYEQY